MKRLISLLFFLALCCAVQSHAGMNAYIAGSVTSTASCGVLFEQSTQDAYAPIGDDSPNIYNMTTFTPTAGSIKTVYLKGYRSGTGSVLTGYLCDSKNSPPVPDDDPACVAADATFDTSTIGTDYSYNIKFNWTAGYTVDAAQHIFLVVDDGADSSNYARWGYNSEVDSNYFRRSADGSTYNSIDLSAQGSMKVTSCEE